MTWRLIRDLAKHYASLYMIDMAYGPLHILVEDECLDDEHLDMVRAEIVKPEDRAMFEFLERMPERLRYIVQQQAWRHIWQN